MGSLEKLKPYTFHTSILTLKYIYKSCVGIMYILKAFLIIDFIH